MDRSETFSAGEDVWVLTLGSTRPYLVRLLEYDGVNWHFQPLDHYYRATQSDERSLIRDRVQAFTQASDSAQQEYLATQERLHEMKSVSEDDFRAKLVSVG